MLPLLHSPCSDHEAEWQALEQAQAQEAAWQRQQRAEREQLELALLQQPDILAQHQQQQHAQEPAAGWGHAQEEGHAGDAMHEWLAEQQVAAGLQAASHGYSQQHAAPALALHLPGDDDQAEQGSALAAAPWQQLPPLPSPITFATTNLDRATARLLASAGNTPTGPLGKAAGRLPDGAADGGAQQAQRAQQGMWLLEPVMPAPLGEGVRCAALCALAVLGGGLDAGWLTKRWR